jgi:hypothetical protein
MSHYCNGIVHEHSTAVISLAQLVQRPVVTLMRQLCVQGPAVCHITGVIHVHGPDPGTLHCFLN